MEMIKSILVPMGTSGCSHNALKTAINLANLFKATLRLLYVEDTTKMVQVILKYRMSSAGISLDLPGLNLQQNEIRIIQDEIDKEKEQVNKFYDSLKDTIGGDHSLVIRTGEIHKEVLSEARAFDLIVMGKALKTGQTGELQPPVFNVVKHANRPVIALCEGESLGKNILIAYDGSRAANNALRVTGDIISAIAPDVVNVLTVKHSEEEAKPLLEEVENYFRPYKLNIEKIWKSGRASENIIKTAEEKKCTCIVMGGYGDNKIKEFLLGGTAEKVLINVDIPVMVCNA